ncbi:predicted protein [Chaetomium globosum CBS 148.51]|uniref:Uncharacterized protein n=1 Tax=Chaetomium globosum (strain ATCC 6205 / CBS 148.51 / DSM 1962 / NBRC 6347 / NRRL 1970) TaxID=306901 RepID=Q2GWQ4_CHAGB|nr:uncharacterized protein CHGG_07600 [Chaetomium globosum CBS 148.51]EAQ86347.1 predicted protein [Chaetomium globosum CBS 148.51]
MQNLLMLSLFGLLAVSFANAALLENTQPLDHALILSRQAPGTPQYECHSNCGNALAGGRNPTHCTNATWTGYYDACLECALEFDIWRIYGTGVGGAASACGLSATPSPAAPASSAPTSVPAPTPTTETETGTETGTGTAVTTPPPPSSAATDAETANSGPSATSSVSTAGAAPGPLVVPSHGSTSSWVGVLVAGLAGLVGLL